MCSRATEGLNILKPEYAFHFFRHILFIYLLKNGKVCSVRPTPSPGIDHAGVIHRTVNLPTDASVFAFNHSDFRVRYDKFTSGLQIIPHFRHEKF